ncbi:MAG: Flp pilus assembly protein CpaB [Verrucomicrobiales bacterium]
MGSRKIIMLVASILIGALAGFALLNYVNGVESDVRGEVQRVPVFVISGDVPAGTTASDVQQTGRIEERLVESGFRPTNAISDLSQIQGRIALNTLAANQILVSGMFADPEVVETTYADLIADDHVAFSMTIEKAKAVNGFIEPGDFVDIIVLGEPPQTAGEEDAFESSAATSPYKRPARYLYRGVRIVSIDRDIVGSVAAPASGDAPGGEAEGEGGSLDITLAVPASAAQRILSVNETDIVLSLLPSNWEPTAQTNEVLDAILLDEDLPGENPDLITPFGPEGFVDLLADKIAEEQAAAAAEAEAAAAEAASQQDPTDGDS